MPIIDGLPGGILTQQKRQKSAPVEPDIFRAFIANVHFNQHCRVAGDLEDSMSIAGYRNLVEPTFSDSANSPLLQLADVIAYLLMIQDASARKLPDGFKPRVAAVADKLDKTLVTKWRGRMNMR